MLAWHAHPCFSLELCAIAEPSAAPRSPAGCSAELAKLSERHGAGYVVTEADIKAATAAAMAAALGCGR